MKKVAFSIVFLAFFSACFYSCKKTSTSPLIGAWAFTATSNSDTNMMVLNIPDNSNYNMSVISNTLTAKNVVVGRDTGTYSYSSNMVTFTSTGATSACLNRPGVYSFSISGNYLTIAVISDSCYFSSYLRSSFISSANWVK